MFRVTLIDVGRDGTVDVEVAAGVGAPDLTEPLPAEGTDVFVAPDVLTASGDVAIEPLVAESG